MAINKLKKKKKKKKKTIIVGGLLTTEGFGFIQVHIKQHRGSEKERAQCKTAQPKNWYL